MNNVCSLLPQRGEEGGVRSHKHLRVGLFLASPDLCLPDHKFVFVSSFVFEQTLIMLPSFLPQPPKSWDSRCVTMLDAKPGFCVTVLNKIGFFSFITF